MGIKTFKEILTNLGSPPKKLYYKGDISLLNSNKVKVAIVGSRKQSRYGFTMLDCFFEDEIFKDCVIVTGGAYGTDMQACKLAIENNIPLIVFLASGVNNYTPKRYAYVFNPMPKNVLLVSESDDDYIPHKYDFVKRNRLISACADLIYLNEASEKSGALHTADFGLQVGKEIACLPARITDYNYAGCLKLIQNGSHVITSSDVFKELIQSLKRKII